MNKYITLTRSSAHRYRVYWQHGKFIGQFIRDVDGFFYYVPTEEKGTWGAHSMRCIADELDRLNKPWDQRIDRHMRWAKRKLFWIKVAKRVKGWFKRLRS